MTIHDRIPEPHGSEYYIDEATYYYEGALEGVKAVVAWLNANGHRDAANKIERELSDERSADQTDRHLRT